MSYDVTIYCSHCSDVLADENYTSNTSEIWRDAGCNIRDFAGGRVDEFGPALRTAIANIEADREKYLPIEAKCNGWGTVNGTLQFLRRLEKACAHAPAGSTVGVSY